MIDILIDEIVKKKAPIVVGLDPTLKNMPKSLVDKHIKEEGESLEAIGNAIFEYNKTLIDSFADLVPSVKPNIAFYEQFGIPGLVAYQKTCSYSKEKGLVVIGDIKRGDIGSTSEAYARAHVGSVSVGSKSFVPFEEDFVTVNPYLGTDGIKPFIDVAREHKKGMFVLVKTSNPSSGEFQDKMIDGKHLYEAVGKLVDELGSTYMGKTYSYIGAVVGATYPEVIKAVREVMPKAMLLVPGYGAQGASGKDLAGFFDENGLGAIVNSSRGIIAAYKNPKYEKYGEMNYGDAARAAVLDMKEDLTQPK